MKLIPFAKSFLNSRSLYNVISKRHFNEFSSQTLIDPSYGLSEEDRQLQEGKFTFFAKTINHS